MNTVTNHSTGTTRPEGLRLENLTDPELYALCKKYGLQARLWRQKFAGTLPEVAKRELHKKRGYSSIYEFAGKLSGMSHDQTRRVLQIAVKLQDKPHLKKLLVEGTQGWAKIETVAYVATKETDERWAKKVTEMPKQALQVFVQEYKTREKAFTARAEGLRGEIRGGATISQCPAGGTFETNGKTEMNTLFDSIQAEGYKEYHEEKWNTLSFAVSPEMEFELRLLKQTVEKNKGEAITWNEFMEEIVDKYKDKSTVADKNKKRTIAHLNNEVRESTTVETKIEKGTDTPSDDTNTDTSSRNIPVDIKRFVLKKYNHRCAYPKCELPPDIFHHTDRFALNGKHDIHKIVPICKKHERFAHTGEIVNEDIEASQWYSGDIMYKDELKNTKDGSEKLKIDEKVNMYRLD